MSKAKAVYVCIPASWGMSFPDNKTSLCAEGCGTLVQHRPHAPQTVRKICIACADKLLEREPGPHRMGITESTLRDLQLYLHRGAKQ